VIGDAPRDWTYKRSARQPGIAELRQLWQEAMHDQAPGVSNAGTRRSSRRQERSDAAGTTALREGDLFNVAASVAQDNPHRAATFIRG